MHMGIEYTFTLYLKRKINMQWVRNKTIRPHIFIMLATFSKPLKQYLNMQFYKMYMSIPVKQGFGRQYFSTSHSVMYLISYI